jgi:hypothetical protein
MKKNDKNCYPSSGTYYAVPMASVYSLVGLLQLGSRAMALYIQGKESYIVIIKVKFSTFIDTCKF